MHILHLTPYMSLGGTERHILNLIIQSLSRGYQISLASPWGEGLGEVPSAVRIHQIENWRGLKLLSSIKALKEMVLALKDDIDLIQVHASAEMAYLVKKYLIKKPVIFTCHGYNTCPPYFNYWLAARFLKNTDCIVVLTPEEKEYFLRGGIKESQLVVISNGVEERFFHTFSFPRNNGKVIGLVGRLVKEKNFTWAIRAQAKYKFASKLLIVGKGPYRLRLEKAFALVILEALATGVPVLIPQWLSGVREFYGSAPGVVIFGGAKDLKQKVEREQGRLKEDEIQAFARNFLWENIFDKYEELYNQLLMRNRYR